MTPDAPLPPGQVVSVGDVFTVGRLLADPDAPLPLADDHPRLTEQEKAANRRRWWGLTDLAAEILELVEDSPGHTVVLYRSDVRRIIAALRASRAEVERLRAERDELRAEVERVSTHQTPHV